MNELELFFEKNTTNLINKWIHYFEIYDRFFRKYQNKEMVILEIGVFQGGSLNLWRDYFGEKAKIYAIDINPECKQFESQNTKIFIGSQEDKEFLSYVKTQIPIIDILIDDGGHTMSQQIISFEELYGHINENGIYLCEDLHTSYWKNYGGGYKSSNSFIEYSKNFIDFINAWHSQDEKLTVNSFTRSSYALHYYDSILVIEKRKMRPSEVKMTGKIIIDLEKFYTPNINETIKNQSFLNKLYQKISHR